MQDFQRAEQGIASLKTVREKDLTDAVVPTILANCRCVNPIEVSLETILEDPDQPRNSFDVASLNELAESIKMRGVKSPISLRPGPDGTASKSASEGGRGNYPEGLFCCE